MSNKRGLVLVPLLGAGLILSGCPSGKEVEKPAERSSRDGQTVKMTAKDGLTVYGQLYSPAEKPRSIAICFHQAGSNSGEYREIAPRLVLRGIACLAVDQRAGGTMWDQDNRTQKDSGRTDWKYEDAYQDMMAAYEWAKSKGYMKVVVWGSSYSASLVLRLANEVPVSAVVAFSPGEYFANKTQVGDWNATLSRPSLFAFSKKEAVDGGFTLYERAPKTLERKSDVLVLRDDGIHGNSVLLADKSNPTAAGYYWKMLFAFFDTQRIGGEAPKSG